LEKHIKSLEEIIGDFEEGQRRLKEENSKLKEEIKDLKDKETENLKKIRKAVQNTFEREI
jgi:predicted  nucleic acid-binding Zn-ribbon protein